MTDLLDAGHRVTGAAKTFPCVWIANDEGSP